MKTLLVSLVLVWAAVAYGHKPSDSYLSLRVNGARLEGQWDIALRDLDYAIGLDTNGDGDITWGELRARHDAIAAYALARLRIEANGAACTSQPRAQLIDRHSDGAYTVLRFVVECSQPPRTLDLRYSLFFDLDPQHRGILQWTSAAGAQTVLFRADRARQHVDAVPVSAWRRVRDFWRDGVWHVCVGVDHVLFLLALLMPSVLRREAGRWYVVRDLREACRATLKVVLAFTLASSLSLSLAALGAVNLPARLVESGIAASVIVVAFNNALPFVRNGRWLVGFGFGLLHGFGCAAVLADPSLPRAALVFALLGFNAGVETGQLMIVALFLPLAFAARRSWVYQRLTLVIGSSLIAAVAVVWLAQRALEVRLLSL